MGEGRVVSRPWEVDFVAVSVALGEPMPQVVESLGAAGAMRAGEIVHTLQARAKTARAIALATALAEVWKDLEGMELQ
jgi:hypothetical protein